MPLPIGSITPLRFQFLLLEKSLNYKRENLQNFKIITPVVAKIAILGVVSRWPKDVVIVLYCFRPHPTITTINLRSPYKFLACYG